MTKNLNDDDLRPVSGGGGGAQDLDRSPNPSPKPDSEEPVDGDPTVPGGGGTEPGIAPKSEL